MGLLVVGCFIAEKLGATDRNFDDRYYILASPTDRLVLRANEVAIIDETVGFDSTYNWVNILYKQGRKDFANIILPLGLTDGTMPLTGPGVVMLNTNDVFIYGAEYTGAVGFKIIHPKYLERYVTLTSPVDRLILMPGETAMIQGTVSFDWEYAWMNILYRQGRRGFMDLELPLGALDGDLTPLPGPGVVMLNKNDVFTYGAEYTGAVGFKVVHTIHEKVIPRYIR